MPKSKKKSKASPQPLPLGHLYDAMTHAIGLTNPFPDPNRVSLSPDLLPRIISFLEPTKSEDLHTLLALQRVSSHGWECVTPLLYRAVTIYNWSRFLRLPDGCKVPATKSLFKGFECSTPAQARSLIRRWRAFQHITTMTIHQLPTFGAYLGFRGLSWSGRDEPTGVDCDFPKLFPQLHHLQISARAMRPICHGGKLASEWISKDDEKKGRIIKAHNLVASIIRLDATLTSGCITLPAKEEHTMAWALMQLESGKEEYGRLTETGKVVVPANTEDSDVLVDILGSYAEGATISIHNMTDLWIKLLCGHRHQSFNLFYQSSPTLAVTVPNGPDQFLRDYRMHAYLKALVCEPKRDGPNGAGQPRSTWTINGEGNCIEPDEHRQCYLTQLVGHLCVELFHEDLQDEMDLVPEDEDVDSPDVAIGVMDQGIARIKRMKFVKPGEELPCAHCGEQ